MDTFNKQDFRWMERLLMLLAPIVFGGLAVILGYYHPEVIAFRWSPYALMPAVAILANIILLILVHVRRAKINSSFWFSLFLGTIIWWGTAQFLQYSSATPEAAVFWAQFTDIGGSFTAALGLIFVISQTHPRMLERSILPWVGLVGMTLAFFVATPTTDFFTSRDPTDVQYTFYGMEREPGPLLWFWYGWIEIILVLIAVLLISHYRKQKGAIERKQSLMLVLGILVLIIGGSITDVILPLLHVQTLQLALTLSTIQALFFGYGLLRYNLFVINPAAVAPNILQTMAEAVVVTDAQYRIIFSNTQADRLLGDRTQYGNGASLLSAFRPEVSQGLTQKIHTALQGNRVVNIDDVAISQTQKAVTYVDISVSRIVDEDGSLSGIVWVLNDISMLKDAYSQLAEEKSHIEQKVVERTKELQVEHARLQTSVENLPIGFVMTGSNDSVITYNKTALKLLQLTSSSAIQQRLYVDLKLAPYFAACKAERRVLDIGEITYKAKFLHVIVSPILHQEGGVAMGVVALIQDVTQAKQLDQERSQFIMTSSHEMRTPVAIIEGALSNATNPNLAHLDDRGRMFVGKAYQEARHLGELFRDLETVTTIINGKQRPVASRFDIIDRARSVTARFEDRAKQKGLKLQFASPPNPVMVMADPENVEEILTRLIENALKFTPAGAIEVLVELGSDSALVKVIDTGIGISTDDQTKLFKQFDRIQNELTRETKGTGLGLYIARNLVESNGGKIWVQSTPGKGSAFIFTVPLMAVSMEKAAVRQNMNQGSALRKDRNHLP